jgi:hypothetical protein
VIQWVVALVSNIDCDAGEAQLMAFELRQFFARNVFFDDKSRLFILNAPLKLSPVSARQVEVPLEVSENALCLTFSEDSWDSVHVKRWSVLSQQVALAIENTASRRVFRDVFDNI